MTNSSETQMPAQALTTLQGTPILPLRLVMVDPGPETRAPEHWYGLMEGVDWVSLAFQKAQLVELTARLGLPALEELVNFLGAVQDRAAQDGLPVVDATGAAPDEEEDVTAWRLRAGGAEDRYFLSEEVARATRQGEGQGEVERVPLPDYRRDGAALAYSRAVGNAGPEEE